MEEKNTRYEFWNSAAGLGLMLGGVSVAYFALSNLLGGSEKTSVALLISAAGMILWAAKFAGCILIMKAGLKRYAARNEKAAHREIFKLGMTAALLSALIYSGVYLLFVTVINPEMLTEAMHMVSEQYSSYDPGIAEAVENMTAKLPRFTFFVNLTYCTLFGTVLSSILSRNIPSRNPFEQTPFNQE